MPEVFREIDLAVFTNRCEGGTNLVAMEAMNAGVMCTLSRNTGHIDLIQDNNCLPLNHQSQIALAANSTEGWGESSVEETLSTMEAAYRGRHKTNVKTIVDSVAPYSWERTIALIADELSQ